MEGLVRYGINNRYTVCGKQREYECTLKGKILDSGADEYAALAAGDRVEFEVASDEHSLGVIQKRFDRATAFGRWNNKRNRVQVLAANIDGVVCVSSVRQPAFRARFIERVTVSAEWYEVEPIIVVNKTDLGNDEEIPEYTDWMVSLGYRVFFTSARTGEGIQELQGAIAGRRFLFVGHSGVGKTSLINRMCPDAELTVREVSRKYQKGVHTTRHSLLLERDDGGWVIDAPGIREIELVPDIEGSLAHCFPEIRAIVSECDYPGCTHLHEPGCAVIDAVEHGRLPELRYESYCILYESLEERNRILRES